MKFNKFNISHYFIFAIGFVIFNISYIFRKLIKNKSEDTVILYGHKLYGNLKSLYSVLDGELNCFYLTLDYKNYKKLSSQNFKVLYGLNIKHINRVVNCKIFVTDHGTHYFKKMIRQNKKIFIDVNHGLPMQKWNEKIVSQWYRFTEVWLMSNMHKKIYINDFGYKEKNNLIVTGYGRLDYLKKFIKSENNVKTKSELLKKYNFDENKQIILYAPTWIHNKSLVSDEFMSPKKTSFIKFLDEISNELNINLIFRPHINTTFNRKDKKILNSLKHITFMPQDKYDSVEDFMILSDILITDYSSIAFDYLLLNRPVIFLNTLSSFDHGLFKDSFFRYGKITEESEIRINLKKYLENPNLYFEDCPQHLKTLEELYDDTESIASEIYLDRIRNFF